MNIKRTFAMSIALTILLVAATAHNAFADAHCFCKISCTNLSGQTNASMVIKDLGPLFTYKGINPQKEDNQRDCNNLCTNAAASYIGSQSIASAACALGCGNGAHVSAFSAVGTAAYRAVAPEIGVLKNTPAVIKTVCTCPAPWINPQNVVGGVTDSSKMCKIGVCFPITPGPGTSLPPNGTSTPGSPNFWTWGNGLYESAPVATCVTTVISPAVCKF
jgi:hypothetical protein